MRLAHVRERAGPAGSPWRLVAALRDGRGWTSDERWMDLEIARRRAVAADPNLAHDRVLHRQPITTLDDHLARGLRVEALGELVDGFTARATTMTRCSRSTTSTSVHRSSVRRASVTSTRSRATSG